MSHLYLRETQSQCFTERCQTSIKDKFVTIPDMTTADGSHLETWRDAPDGLEGNHGELASPVQSNTDST